MVKDTSLEFLVLCSRDGLGHAHAPGVCVISNKRLVTPSEGLEELERALPSTSLWAACWGSPRRLSTHTHTRALGSLCALCVIRSRRSSLLATTAHTSPQWRTR
jgi:hypothetical protein